MTNEITLTKDGGNFYSAMIVHALSVVFLAPLVLALVILAVINPFWFRDNFFRWVEKLVNRLTKWRDYIKYRVYLGVDPKVWHALKDKE